MSAITINEDFIDIDEPKNTLKLSASGEYYSDSNIVYIHWASNIENGIFRLMESADNDNYETIATLNNQYEYDYYVTEKFEQKFFKIEQVTDDGAVAETEPFVIYSEKDINDDKVQIIVSGKYNLEDSTICLQWVTDVENGIFNILKSEDGRDYELVATLNNDYEYYYFVTEKFEQKYFKIEQVIDDEVIAESEPLIVMAQENIDQLKENLTIDALGELSNNLIHIYWIADVENGVFKVMESQDNEKYTEVSTLDDEYEYNYEITEDFNTKYFKIIQISKDGSKGESIPFKVVFDGEGYNIEYIDSDKDGISDMFERLLNTDIDAEDTDKDGLTDYQEVYITETSLSEYSSVTVGLSDADADCDSDGLSNIEEINRKMIPLEEDTDKDGLKDGDEVNIYMTSPLEEDTDGDGLKDGDEIQIGLDPNDSRTFGVPDSEYVCKQTIAEDSKALCAINTKDAPYRLLIETEATGYVEGNLVAKESGYENVISNDAMLGKALELNCVSCDVKKIVLRFHMTDINVNNKTYTVFKYFEDIDMLLPIKTEYDLTSNTIYTEVDEFGTYCIMDMEELLLDLNTGIQVYNNESRTIITENEFKDEDTCIEFNSVNFEGAYGDLPATYTIPRNKTRDSYKPETPLDIVFLLQSSGTSEELFFWEKQLIMEVCDYLYYDYYNYNDGIRVYIIEYGVDSAGFIGGDVNRNYCTTQTEVSAALKQLEHTQSDSYCNRGTAFECMLNKIDFREYAGKFAFRLINGKSTVEDKFLSELDACADGKINYSEIFPQGYAYINSDYAESVTEAIAKTGGLSLTYDMFETENEVYHHIINNLTKPQLRYNIILPTNWRRIELDDIISSDNNSNSDGDKLSDWLEIDNSNPLISWSNSGEIQLPTVKDCLEACSYKKYAKEILEEYVNSQPDSYEQMILNLEILPINSNPCEEDTDGDGYLDDTDIDPMYYDEINGEIYQSEHALGIGYTKGKIADDLLNNDYDKESR